jgi:hypothetical protein
MIVVKLRDESLWINSPVEASPALLDEVKALGPVRYLVAPTPLHVWRLAPWGALFPDAELWGPGRLHDDAPSAWAADIDQVVFRGNVFLNETEFFHKPSRTLMVTDYSATL